MKCNMGNMDRLMRFILGAVILTLGAIFECTLGWLGLIPILTATIGWCPAYIPLGISTCRNNSDD